MSYKIRFSKQAGEDLESIYSYHANNLMVPEKAERITKNIKETIKSLRVFPFRHKKINDLEVLEYVPSHVELRSVVQDGYRIFYCIRGAESEIVVLSILNNTGNMEKI